MLLARKGYRVLLVDKARFPSDAMSTHLVHPPAVAALARWGILERLEATNCPPISRYSFDFGPVTIAGSPLPANGESVAFGPRRIVLDALLVEAAVAAGAELREGFTVEEVLLEDGRVMGIRGHAKGGAPVSERARVVIGADGKHSLLAKAVQPERYNEMPGLAPSYYAYWSGLPTDAFDVHIRAENGRGWAAIPTHDDLHLRSAGLAAVPVQSQPQGHRGHLHAVLRARPRFRRAIHGAKRETRFVGTGDLPGFFCKPYGPGWTLVGDAGYPKHPITAFGITDAFRDAEAVASDSITHPPGGARTRRRWRLPARPRPGSTADLRLHLRLRNTRATSPAMPQLIGAMQGNQAAMDGFVSVMAGTLPAQEFFGPDHAGRIMAQAGAPPD